MRRFLQSILCFTVLCCIACSEEREVVEPTPTFHTSDIDLFWELFDATEVPSRIDFQSLYIDQGTEGLRDYAEQKNLASGLPQTLSDSFYLQYYNDVRRSTMDVSKSIEISSQAFQSLKEIYSDTRFFDVYFLIGAMTAGGRVSDNGLLVAVEMFSKQEDTDISSLNEWHQNVLRDKDYLPSLVVHEFVHMQQQFRPRDSDLRTTLEQSIVEGMADFISQALLPNEPFVNDHLHHYGDSVEAEIWSDFSRVMDANFRTTEWLYTGRRTALGHPADMGYCVGYKILELYAAQFATVDEAIVAMLSASDYVQIFEQSGYQEKF